MATFLELRLRSQQVIQQQLKIIENNKKMAQSVRETTDETKKFDRAAERLKASVLTPAEKHNKQLKELARLYATGRINLEQLTRAQDRYNRELLEAERGGKKAFGARALADLKSMAVGFFGLQAAVSAVTQAFQELEQKRQEAAQRARSSRQGLGSLAQLVDPGASDSERGRQFRALTAEARGLVSQGAAVDEGEAGRILFSLRSAGATPSATRLLANLSSQGVISDPAGFARDAKTLITSLGEKETGGFEALFSKAFAASKESPIEGPALLSSAARSGAAARALGLDDESILAAATILSSATGSAERGGTALESLLGQAGKSGEFEGKSFREILTTLQAGGTSFKDLQGALGERKAASAAFTLIENLSEFDRIRGQIVAGEQRGDAGRLLGVTSSDPQLAAANLATRATGAEDVSRGGQGRIANLTEAILAGSSARARETNPGLLTELGLKLERSLITNVSNISETAGLKLASERLGTDDPELRRQANEAIKENTSAISRLVDVMINNGIRFANTNSPGLVSGVDRLSTDDEN